MMTPMNSTSTWRSFLLSMVFTATLWAAMPVADVYAITLKQAVQQVEQQYQGKVVSARTVTQNGKRIHVIRVVTKNGVVKTVRIPE